MANSFKVIIAAPKVLQYAAERGISAKFMKARAYLAKDIRHSSLRTELLEPKSDGVYSFRVDRKYRGLFFFNTSGEIEIFALTNHYKK